MTRFATVAAVLAVSLAAATATQPPAGDDQAAALKKLGANVAVTKGAVTSVQIKVDKLTPDGYRALGKCATVKKLTISGKTLTDETLPLLASLTDLEELSTDQTTLSDDGYRHFTAFKDLRSLALFHPSWGLKGFTGRGLAHLKALPKLRRLTFAGSTAGDEALEAVGKLAQLTEFRTWHTTQTQAGNEHLTRLPNLTSLMIGQRLPKWGTSPPASFDESTVPTLARIKSLERLELFEARLSAKGLAPLKGLPNLKRLSIHTTDISPADVEALRKALPGVTIDFKPISAKEREETLVKKLKL